MKKNKISKNWIIKQHRDLYFKRSKVEGFRSRSAYKLLELDKKYTDKRNLALEYGKKYKEQFYKKNIAKNIIDIFNSR